MKTKTSVSVFNYTDYRTYLSDYISEQKKAGKGFSYRKFAEKAGYNSSGLLIDVIKKRTNINPDVVAKFTKGLGLNSKESDYFDNLVKFNQSKTTENKNHYFGKMVRLLSGKATTVRTEDHKYFSLWYYPAVREILAIFEFRGDYSELAQHLRPTITAQEAKGAISFLLKNGFIRIDETGRYVAVQQTLTTDADVYSLNTANFRRNMMQLGIESIDRFKPADRNVSSITFSVSHKAIPDIKAEIEACHARIKNIIEKSTDDDILCQLNFQLFPLSDVVEKKNVKEGASND
ncbi:MAG: TIGR02147 family protein [Fibrobacteres bacterium]|nr:TIGR02147 family protein [Fibrobacterota bacterium]